MNRQDIRKNVKLSKESWETLTYLSLKSNVPITTLIEQWTKQIQLIVNDLGSPYSLFSLSVRHSKNNKVANVVDTFIGAVYSGQSPYLELGLTKEQDSALENDVLRESLKEKMKVLK